MNEKARQTAVFLQNACLQHQYIRSRDLSAIVERPERLRAVTIGVSAAIARLEETAPESSKSKIGDTKEEEDRAGGGLDLADALAGALDRMKLERDKDGGPLSSLLPVIIQSHATVDLSDHAAVKYIHGDIDGDVYIEKLTNWAKESWEKVQAGGSEIPPHLSQGDLYLCPESITAIQGALGTVCEAVDRVILSSRLGEAGGASSVDDLSINHAFVVIRPPGHHCGDDTPCGFCFVNNVAVGAAHAHLKHGITRVVIFDVDLHHGNGTQSIVWQINEETYRQKLDTEGGGTPPATPGMQVYYGSVHDVLSYPCEDGKPELVQAASVSIHQAHGQYIENVHMQSYNSEPHFWDVLYKEQYGRILRKAEDFLRTTGGGGGDEDNVMIFISCGMDACEHEYASMSRHNRKVPASLYYRFTRDVGVLADQFARGRVVSVLEGGYSDRALMSGAMAHLCGLVDDGGEQLAGSVNEEWWNVDNLIKIEKATKKRRGGRSSLSNTAGTETWLERTLEIFHSMGSWDVPVRTGSSPPPPPSTMTLRERREKTVGPIQTEIGAGAKEKVKNQKKVDPSLSKNLLKETTRPPTAWSSEGEPEASVMPRAVEKGTKKLPRVVLKLGPRDPSKESS